MLSKMRLKVEDIIRINAGRSKAFQLEDRKACNSARVMCQYVQNKGLMPKNVERYATQTDDNTIIITAVRRSEVL